jgi:ABC-type multidrug transport system ATPase subunit
MASQTRPDAAHVRSRPAEAGDGASAVRVEASGVSLRAGGQLTLRNVSVSIAPGELVAVAGSSGAGKTMLLETLAGLRHPDEGTVRYDGVPGQASLAAFRSSLGYVPQDDIIHRELPLGRTLEYAARLRLPAGAGPARAAGAARRVLGLLGLADRADVAVGSLSGGERKRASIGVELLTAPRLFFLDEPTSGLDPVTAAGVTGLLRRLADDGTTVILTTHNVADLDACDRIVFLASDGSLAFAGSAGQAREHFGTTRLEEVYQRLDARHRAAPGPEPDPPEPGPAPELDPEPEPGPAPEPSPAREPGPIPAPRPAPEPSSGPGAVRQWALLTRRSLDILVRGRLTVAILLGSPVMILLMFVVLFPPDAFSPAHPGPNVALMTTFWIAFAGFFFGLSYGLPQICAELAILRREHHVGVGLGPYVLSKLAVLLPLLAVVDAVTLAVLRVLHRLPATSAAQTWSLFATLVLASAAALALGLLTSAAVTGPSQAVVAMPMLCFPQVLFSGAFLPVPAMAAAGRVISYAMSNRWAFEGLGHAAGLPALWAGRGSPLGPPLLASYGGTFSGPPRADWVILAGFTVVFLAAARLVLGARCGRPARRGAS